MADEYIHFELKGLSELEANLKTLDEEVQTKVVRNAVRAGATVFKNEMVTLAPKDTGLLAEHFDIRTKKTKGVADAVTAFIGPNAKVPIHQQVKGITAGMKRTALKIASFLEFGTSKLGKRPFMTQTFESSKSKAIDATIEKMKQGLAKWGLK
jgi:HK97 gp10 family phage protein